MFYNLTMTYRKTLKFDTPNYRKLIIIRIANTVYNDFKRKQRR